MNVGKLKSEEISMKKVYIASTNGGNELLVNADGRWFNTNCAPDGMFGDVDIYADEPLSVIAFKLEQQIDEIGGVNTDDMRIEPIIENMEIDQIIDYCNDGHDCDLCKYYFVGEWDW